MSYPRSKKHSFLSFGKAMLLFVMLLAVAMPALGQIKSARARVLTNVGELQTKRKGNFKAGDILSTPLVSITVVNGPAVTWVQMNLEITFPPDSNLKNDYARVTIQKEIGSNVTFTFTNKDLLDYLGDVKKLEKSDTLITNTGVDDIKNIGNLQLPEGIYEISLSADEGTVSGGVFTKSKSLVTETMSFKVVTIGNLSNITMPSVNDKTLRFTVPQIPIYDDTKGTSTSKTRVKITSGTDYSWSLSKDHAKSTGSSGAIKGYPSDLASTNGEVIYDLSNILFRAGRTYSIEMNFDDWNGDSITSLTKSVSFPAHSLSSGIDTTDPYRPIFSWAWGGTDYTAWTKNFSVYYKAASEGSYRLLGTTSGFDMEVSSSLLPGTTYNWYVMPYYSDNTPFSTSFTVWSFTTAPHTVLTVGIQSPPNNAVLLAGQEYAFSGSAEYSHNAELKTATWTVGGRTLNGLDTSFTPAARVPNNGLQARLAVTDSLNLEKTATSYYTVLKPSIAVKAPTQNVTLGSSVGFSLDTANTLDVQNVEWFVDGSSVGTGTTKNHTFTEVGTHEVYAEGTTRADFEGRTSSATSAVVTYTVVGAAPKVTITQPATLGDLVVNSTLDIVATVENENPLKSTVWTVSGPDTSQNNSQGELFAFRPKTAGEYSLSVKVTDQYDKTATASIRVFVVDPSVSVTSPTVNSTFALTSTLTPVIVAPYADRITWQVDGQPVAGSSLALSTLGSGDYNLWATAVWNVMDTTGGSIEYSEDSPRIPFKVRDYSPPVITLDFPANGMLLRSGLAYTFSARVASQAGEEIPSAWWEIDGSRVENGAAWTPAAGLRKTVNVVFKARSAQGVEASKSASVRVISPSLSISTSLANNETNVGAQIPLLASSTDITGSFYIVDGVELGTWNRIFTEPGQHTVQLGWNASWVNPATQSSEDFSGTSNTLTFTAYSNTAPVITGNTPANLALREARGRAVTFSIEASSENTLQAPSWTVLKDGASAGEGTGGNFTFTFADAGQYTVRATARDNRGLASTRDWTVKVIDPMIVITSPQSNTIYGANAVATPVVSTRDLNSWSFYLDAVQLPAGFNWNSVAVGNHRLYAEGLYSVSSAAAPETIRSAEVTFSVENRTPPAFTIEGVKDGDRLVAGQQYSFTVSRQGNETISWSRSGSTQGFTGTQFTFVPTATEKEITFTVRGTLNNLTAEKSFKVKVVDPYISIIIPSGIAVNGRYPAQSPIPLQTERRDIDRVEWQADGSTITGTSVRFAAGTHTLAVRGFAVGVRLSGGSYGDYEYAGSGQISRSLEVVALPVLSGLTATPAAILQGETVTATASVEGAAEFVASYAFAVNGTVVGRGSAPTRTFTNLPVGRNRLGVTLTDVFGGSSSRETEVTVYAPLTVSITKPVNNERLSPETNVVATAVIGSGQYNSIVWTLDGRDVAGSNATTVGLGKLASGVHVIGIRVSGPGGAQATASANVEVSGDFLLNLVAPASDTTLILGSSLNAAVSLTRVAGSDIDLSDAAANISWLVNGNDTGSTGLSYRFEPAQTGSFTLQARYRKGDMTRLSPQRRVQVRDIAVPAILAPLNGATISYSNTDSVQLSGTGEPGATFTWFIDGAQVAMGQNASFAPNGMTGQKQLRLVTTASGRSAEKLVTFTLLLNTPPTVNLVAAPVQFTGSNLAWTASAVDVEDGAAIPAVEVFFDGVRLDAATPRALTAADIGRHVLMARARDSKGLATTRQVELSVEPSAFNILMLSPVAGRMYLQDRDLTLQAIVSAPGGAIVPQNGSLRWTVQYLDAPDAATATFTGLSASFRPAALGEVLVTAGFFDASGRERGTQRATIHVDPTPVTLTIVWPHGSVVNAGQALNPSLVGLPAGANPNAISWTLDGATLPGVGNLVAPDAPGIHTLAAQYSANGSSARSEVTFGVNGRPQVSVTSPQAGTQFVLGSPVVLSAAVNDDQAFSGAVQWTDQRGTPLGQGNPFVLRPNINSEWTVRATVTDSMGLQATSDDLTFTVYVPVTSPVATVNGGLPAYLIAPATPPLAASLQFTGGISPVVGWTLSQGSLRLNKTGNEVSFSPSELAGFDSAFSLLTLVVTDNGLANTAAREVLRREFPIELTRQSLAEIIQPAPGATLWLGEPVALELSLTGFRAPVLSTMLDGAPATAGWSSEDSAIYRGELPASSFAAEGVHQLAITITDGGTVRNLSATLNVYARRTGIFVDNAPAQFDLEGDPVQIQALLSNLPAGTAVRWKTDLSGDPVGSGLALDLSTANLSAGSRTITAEAVSGTAVLSSFSFPLRVLGAMELSVSPAADPLIVQKGAVSNLLAKALDRDGSLLSGESVRWTSHLDGLLGTGDTLELGELDQLSIGEHMLSIEATGASGSKTSMLRRLIVNRPPAGEEQTGQGGTGEDQGGGGGFDEGNEVGDEGGIRDGFGPDGSDMDPDLGEMLGDFFGN